MFSSYIPPSGTSHYDLVNKDGDALCHAVSCRKHKKLTHSHGGLFCKDHLKKIDEIRERILHKTSTEEQLKAEVAARRDEALFRKFMDPAHMDYLYRLEMILKEISEPKK
jgi:hypothetical protein